MVHKRAPRLILVNEQVVLDVTSSYVCLRRKTSIHVVTYWQFIRF